MVKGSVMTVRVVGRNLTSLGTLSCEPFLKLPAKGTVQFSKAILCDGLDKSEAYQGLGYFLLTQSHRVLCRG